MPTDHHDHHHAHLSPTGGRTAALAGVLGANTVLLVVQVAGALAFGSLALLADSVHQFSDVAGLGVALGAHVLAARPLSGRFSYGWRRTEVLGAQISAVLLGASAIWIVVEAISRIGEEHHIDGAGVALIAIAGLAVNGAGAWWLARVAGESLNLRAAVVHLAADAAGSLGVLIAGLAVVWWDATWVDPVVSLALAGLVTWAAIGLLTSTARILLEGTPPSIDIAVLAKMLDDDPQVVDVHHLHVWSLDSETVALTAHVVVSGASLHEAQTVADRLRTMLHAEGIAHSTLELECHECEAVDHI